MFPQILPHHDYFILGYVKIEKLDMESLKNQFLKSIGGQSHVLCSEHKLLLIHLSTCQNVQNVTEKNILHAVILHVHLIYVEDVLK